MKILSRANWQTAPGWRSLAFILLLAVLGVAAQVARAETWQEALAKMPLRKQVAELNKTNVAETLLDAFQASPTVKALVFMPGATDEYYFFNRGVTRIDKEKPTLLDAVVAMTNQTQIRVLFYPPLLLLQTEEEPKEPLLKVIDAGMAAKLKGRPFVPSFSYNDEDWNFLQPVLVKNISGRFLGFPAFLPPPHTMESWHFFRHTVAGNGLTQWEALEALSLAGQTVVTIRNTKIIFEGDLRLAGKQVTPKTR